MSPRFPKWGSLTETLTEALSILSDPKLLRDIKRGMSDIRKGKLIPHDKIKREFC